MSPISTSYLGSPQAALSASELVSPDNNVIVLMKCASLPGNVSFKGYEKTVRLSQWPGIIILNPFNPRRSDTRTLSNPQLLPITLNFSIGAAVPLTFQSLCNGTCLKIVTITELISDGKNLQKLREVTLTNPYITNWRIVGLRDGLNCEVTLEYDQFTQTRASVGQNQKKQGTTAAKGNKKKQQPK